MALVDLWKQNRDELLSKQFHQIIAYAGNGRLLDDSPASKELRDFLQNVPSDLLSTYVDQCLQNSFNDSGIALQDLVNEIGRRLEFDVSPGRYRGTTVHVGHDGIWTDTDNHSIVIEVKTTDAYRIKLDSIARYRQSLAEAGKLSLDHSSMLIVVGRQDTGDLEAQIRGSRHAWDMRVISVEALFRMLKLKEDIEEPSVIRRIHEILVPREFTRLDPIIEIAFAAVEDVKQSPVEGLIDDDVNDDEDNDDNEVDEKKFTPVAFHAECIIRIEQHLSIDLIKLSRASFATADQKIRIICSVSRYHEHSKRYWFAFHPHQAEFLDTAEQSYVAYGCGDASTLFLIPFHTFKPHLVHFNKTDNETRIYWHVKIRSIGNVYEITSRRGMSNFDITNFKI